MILHKAWKSVLRECVSSSGTKVNRNSAEWRVPSVQHRPSTLSHVTLYHYATGQLPDKNVQILVLQFLPCRCFFPFGSNPHQQWEKLQTTTHYSLYFFIITIIFNYCLHAVFIKHVEFAKEVWRLWRNTEVLHLRFFFSFFFFLQKNDFIISKRHSSEQIVLYNGSMWYWEDTLHLQYSQSFYYVTLITG